MRNWSLTATGAVQHKARTSGMFAGMLPASALRQPFRPSGYEGRCVSRVDAAAGAALNTALAAGDLLIRPYVIEDEAQVFATVRDSLESLSYWPPWCDADYALADAQAWIEHCVRVWAERSEFPFGVFQRRTGRFLGGVGLNRLDRRDRSANLGYRVGAAHRGQGVALRAARLAASFGFVELDLIRIEIVVLPDNRASLRVAEKLGATRQALARNRLMFQGKPTAAVIYSLTPDDLAADTPVDRTG